MKSLCSLLVLGLLAFAASAASANEIPGQYIVVYKHSAEAVGARDECP